MKKKGMIYCKYCKHLGPTGYDFDQPQFQCNHPGNLIVKHWATDPIDGPGAEYTEYRETPLYKNYRFNCRDFEAKET